MIVVADLCKHETWLIHLYMYSIYYTDQNIAHFEAVKNSEIQFRHCTIFLQSWSLGGVETHAWSNFLKE